MRGKLLRPAAGIVLGAVACGSGEDSTASTTSAPTVECPDETWEKLTLELVWEDEAAQCLRTEPEERVSVPFCVDLTVPRAFHCVRDDAGREYVVWASESLVPPVGYSLCAKEDLFFERPCYTECDEPTLGNPWLQTLCGEEETRVAGGCGELGSPYDENCCKRPFCFDGVCPTGMSCELLESYDFFVGVNPQTGVCGAGIPGARGAPHCVPTP